MEIVAVPDQKLPLQGPAVSGSLPVTLVGGGALGRDDLDEAMRYAPSLVGVDGGANALMSAGYLPSAVIGDLDSLSGATRARLPDDIVFEIAEQDSTDFDKALRHLHVPLVLAVGFTGARLDHELAVFHSLVARPERRCIVIGEQDIIFHAPPKLTISLTQKTRVSLFPMATVCGTSEGLQWPIDGLVLDPMRRIGTSNEALGGPVCLEIENPGLLVVLPRSCLRLAVDALTEAGDNLWIV